MYAQIEHILNISKTLGNVLNTPSGQKNILLFDFSGSRGNFEACRVYLCDPKGPFFVKSKLLKLLLLLNELEYSSSQWN